MGERALPSPTLINSLSPVSSLRSIAAIGERTLLGEAIIQSVAFTVNDLQDLTRLLRERPEWLSEIRRIVLTDELLALPALVRELVEAQRRNDERFAELAEAQRRTEERLEQLIVRFEEAQRRNDERFAELAEAQRRTEERLAELAEAQRRTEDQVADLRGRMLEIEYRDKVGAIFGGRLRRPKVVDAGDVWELLRERLDDEEIRQVVAADLIVRGRQLPPQDEEELWLVVEVSGVVDRSDVARAAERAALLRKAGLSVVPVVAGLRLTQGAAALSEELGVALAKNGGLAGWDEAVVRAG